MTSVKSKLTTSVRAAKAQIGTKPTPDEPQAADKPKQKPAKPVQANKPAQPAAPAESHSALFPARVWPD